MPPIVHNRDLCGDSFLAGGLSQKLNRVSRLKLDLAIFLEHAL
jgi:hypothetical protein